MVIKNDSCHRNVDWWDFAVGNHSRLGLLLFHAHLLFSFLRAILLVSVVHLWFGKFFSFEVLAELHARKIMFCYMGGFFLMGSRHS